MPASFLTTLDGRPGLTAEISTGEMWGVRANGISGAPSEQCRFKGAGHSSRSIRQISAAG